MVENDFPYKFQIRAQCYSCYYLLQLWEEMIVCGLYGFDLAVHCGHTLIYLYDLMSKVKILCLSGFVKLPRGRKFGHQVIPCLIPSPLNKLLAIHLVRNGVVFFNSSFPQFYFWDKYQEQGKHCPCDTEIPSNLARWQYGPTPSVLPLRAHGLKCLLMLACILLHDASRSCT